MFSTKRRLNKDPQFAFESQFIILLQDHVSIDDVLDDVKKLSTEHSYFGKQFLPCKPTWLNSDHLKLLKDDSFVVTWYSECPRYLLFIWSQQVTFLIDKDNNVFRVFNLNFVTRQDLNQGLHGVILDGEFVLNGYDKPIFVVSDIVAWYKNTEFASMTYEDRMNLINEAIIEPRNAAFRKGFWCPSKVPFNFQLKPFWPIRDSRKILDIMLSEQKDDSVPFGLLFISKTLRYSCGKSKDILKFGFPKNKPADFRLKLLVKQDRERRNTGELFLRNLLTPFARISVRPGFENCDGHTVKCCVFKNSINIMSCNHECSPPTSYQNNCDLFESFTRFVTLQELLEAIENPEDNERNINAAIEGSSSVSSQKPAAAIK